MTINSNIPNSTSDSTSSSPLYHYLLSVLQHAKILIPFCGLKPVLGLKLKLPKMMSKIPLLVVHLHAQDQKEKRYEEILLLYINKEFAGKDIF